jgi:probable HAF family extracellular repeat protein
MSEAVRITNSGLVVGVASRAVKGLVTWPALRGHLVVWRSDGRIRDLGRPWNPSRDTATVVGAVDEHGEIVGSTVPDQLGERSFLWDGKRLRSLPPRSARSEALDVNASGRVIGWTYRESNFRAVTWERGQMRLLPLPPGRKGAFTSAINEEGEIVGYGWANREVDKHAVLWRIGTVIDLGTLGGMQSEAEAINNRRQIVGTSETASDSEAPVWHAFLWHDGRMVDLGSGYPVAINDRGQIIGNSGPYGGHARVWLPN